MYNMIYARLIKPNNILLTKIILVHQKSKIILMPYQIVNFSNIAIAILDFSLLQPYSYHFFNFAIAIVPALNLNFLYCFSASFSRFHFCIAPFGIKIGSKYKHDNLNGENGDFAKKYFVFSVHQYYFR